MTIQRDWTAARAKVDNAPGCRKCGRGHGLEAAHIVGRKYDRKLDRSGHKRVVDPESVVPLCRDCHTAYDSYRLDLLPYLTNEEQARAALDVGLFAAFRRITGRKSLDCDCCACHDLLDEDLDA